MVFRGIKRKKPLLERSSCERVGAVVVGHEPELAVAQAQNIPLAFPIQEFREQSLRFSAVVMPGQ